MAPSADRASLESHVDEALAESFPASDPPAWTLGAPEWAGGAPSVRPSDTIARLRREHGNVELLLLVLESQLARIHRGDDVDEGLVLEIFRYLTGYVDVFHHGREDAAIEMLAERVAVVRAAMPVLTAQHDEIRSRGAALRDRLERAVVDEPVSRPELVRAGFSYARSLRKNMALEEAIVFPAAADVMSPAEWAAIDAKLGVPGDPLFGGQRDDRFRRLFEELTTRAGCACAFE